MSRGLKRADEHRITPRVTVSDEARRLFEEALDLYLDAMRQQPIEDHDKREERLCEARARCCRLASEAPDWVEPAELKAAVLIELGDLKHARDHLARVIKACASLADPEAAECRARAFILLGQVAVEDGNYSEAQSYYERAIPAADQDGLEDYDSLEEAYDGLVSVLRELARWNEADQVLGHGLSALERRGVTHSTLLAGQRRILDREAAPV